MLWATMLILSTTNIYSNCNSSPEPAAPFIPDISNGWKNINDPENTFFFFTENNVTNVTTANITGNVNIPGQQSQAHVTGRFDNTYIEFTYTDGPFNGKKYSGNFQRNSSPLRMIVKSGTETLTLDRLQ